tara:strand:+ start:286 stop:789 length:504 start_codon:yes stop_codon:yes gene_type:complete
VKRNRKNITRTLPIHTYVLDQLEESLDFGRYVKWEEIEYHADMERVKDGQLDPKFQFFFLNLKNVLEQRGFFTTERGVTDGFRILRKDEVADHVKADLIKKTKSIRRKAIGVSHICRKSLTNEDAKKLDHEEKRAAWMAEMNTQLLRRKALPEPSTVKSIKKLLKNG